MLDKKIIGHDFQKNLLLRALREGHISHSYLFAGPDGIGKRLLAIEFARLLNCTSKQKRDTFDSVGCDCSSCNKVSKGIHPDVIYVNYEGVKSIKVEQIREGVEERLFLKSFEGKYKVVIVDEANRMSSGAQNAFLKTLEEPPPYSVIILITSAPDRLLPTIRSRCQLIRFNSLSEDLVFKELQSREDLSADQAHICSKLSRGSLGRALALDSDMIEWRRELIEYLIRLEPTSAMRVIGLAEYMPIGSTPEDSEKLAFVFEFISLWLRDLVLIKTGADNDRITHIDLLESSTEIANKWDLGMITDKMSALEETWNDIYNLNSNKQLSFENLFIKIAS